MDILEYRRWMYHKLDVNKKFQFQAEKLRCPCNKYKCKLFKFVAEVDYDIYEQEFMLIYYWWTNHG
ncbi:hypothetical protein CR513_04549, partial [Mucuna pruriens]